MKVYPSIIAGIYNPSMIYMYKELLVLSLLLSSLCVNPLTYLTELTLPTFPTHDFTTYKNHNMHYCQLVNLSSTTFTALKQSGEIAVIRKMSILFSRMILNFQLVHLEFETDMKLQASSKYALINQAEKCINSATSMQADMDFWIQKHLPHNQDGSIDQSVTIISQDTDKDMVKQEKQYRNQNPQKSSPQVVIPLNLIKKNNLIVQNNDQANQKYSNQNNQTQNSVVDEKLQENQTKVQKNNVPSIIENIQNQSLTQNITY